MGNYYLLRDGLITYTSTYGTSISGAEKTNNTTAYTLLTTDNWSPALSGTAADVIDSIAVHLSSRAATPVGVLSAQTMQYAGPMIRGSTNISTSDSPFVGYNDGSMSLNGVNTTFSYRTEPITFTGDFTIEMWIFPTATFTTNRMLCECYTTTPVAGWQLYYRSTGSSIAFLVNNSTATRVQGSTPIAANNWYHVAVTRQGSNTRMYINGVHEAVSTTIPATITSTAPFNIGTQNSGSNNNGFTGFISNVRIVKGTALYTGTGTFEVPSAPLTVVTGTEFLLQKPYDIYKNSATYALSNVGTYPVSSFTSFDGSNNTVATYPLNWQLLKLSPSFTNSSGYFTLNLKTSNPNQLTLMGTDTVNGVNYDRMVIKDQYIGTSSTNIHIGSIIDGYSTQNRTITANTGSFANIYVHKNGLLKFSDTSTTLTISGGDGLQATSEGTIQIGSSASPIPNNTTHEIILSGNHIGVSNGGRLDVYGAYKPPYTKFAQDYSSGVNSFNTVENITTWKINDTVVLLPNTTSSNTTEVFTINSFSNSNNFVINTFTTGFPHSVLSYVPNVANLTRNVKIGGTSNSAKGNIQTKDGAFVNINNTEFKFIDGSLKTGLSSNGLFSLSGCTLSGNGTETLLTYPVSASGKISINSSIINNVIFKAQYGINLDGVTSSNNTITNNLILSSKDAGIFIKNGLKGSLNFNNNISIGPSPYGSFVQNNTAGITLSSIINYNNTIGTMVSSAHTGYIDNIINTHNLTNGVYVDGAISQLNQTTFTNITASNNRTVGFLVSGNAINHLAPVIININRLVANDNLSGGFEGYCIAGNLSSVELNRNGIYGMKTSIGNYNTTFDGITALMNNVASTSAAIGILSGICYYPILIKDANVGKSVSSSTFGAGISLDSTKFSEFSVDNSTVSGGSSDFQLRTTRNILEGSYLISNTNVGVLPVGVGISTANYQSDVLKTTGFAFTNMNNITGYHVTYLAAGNRSIDSTTTCNINETTSPSERLTPQSNSLKLRSGSKFVALSSGESTAIAVYVRKSTLATNGVAYNGTAPRLILKRNGAMGINSDILMDQLDTTSENFLKLAGVTPVVTDVGVLEFYVDCDGTQGWINIDNWTAN